MSENKSIVFKRNFELNLKTDFKEETVEAAGEYHHSDYDDSEELDDNEFLLPEDMIGQIKDIIFKRNLLNVAREGNETPVENLTR